MQIQSKKIWAQNQKKDRRKKILLCTYAFCDTNRRPPLPTRNVREKKCRPTRLSPSKNGFRNDRVRYREDTMATGFRWKLRKHVGRLENPIGADFATVHVRTAYTLPIMCKRMSTTVNPVRGNPRPARSILGTKHSPKYEFWFLHFQTTGFSPNACENVEIYAGPDGIPGDFPMPVKALVVAAADRSF